MLSVISGSFNDTDLIAAEIGTRLGLMNTCLNVLSIYFNDNVCVAIEAIGRD